MPGWFLNVQSENRTILNWSSYINSVPTLYMDKTEVWGVGVFYTYMVLCTCLLEYDIEVLRGVSGSNPEKLFFSTTVYLRGW